MSYAIDERNPERQQLLARRFPTRRSTSCSAATFRCISPTRRAPQPTIGRTLVRWFKQAGASHVEGGAMLHLEHDAAVLKRMYRLTAEATGPLAHAKGSLNEFEVREMIDGLARIEADPASVLVKFPDMWVIAQR